MIEMVLLFLYRLMFSWFSDDGERMKLPIIPTLWFSPSLVRPFDHYKIAKNRINNYL